MTSTQAASGSTLVVTRRSVDSQHGCCRRHRRRPLQLLAPDASFAAALHAVRAARPGALRNPLQILYGLAVSVAPLPPALPDAVSDSADSDSASAYSPASTESESESAVSYV